MKKISCILLLSGTLLLQAQYTKKPDGADGRHTAYRVGEFLRYRIHYGILNAGFANLTLAADTINGKAYIHAQGYGYSTGLVRLFFKVADRYETYIEPDSPWPKHFVRQIHEGRYTKNVIIDFHQDDRIATVQKIKKNMVEQFPLQTKVQDMISAFYFLRSVEESRLQVGAELALNLFFDNRSYPFKLKVLAADRIKTRFGRIDCLKVQPLVVDGRVFKDREGVSIWVSRDENRIPIHIEAKLSAGTLRADLVAFKNLAHPIRFLK